MSDAGQAPVPLSRGSYALYETPDGGALLAYRPDGADEDQHQPIPAQLWRLAMAAMRGEKITPAAMVKTIMGAVRN